jgi:hypothetical protein
MPSILLALLTRFINTIIAIVIVIITSIFIVIIFRISSFWVFLTTAYYVPAQARLLIYYNLSIQAGFNIDYCNLISLRVKLILCAARWLLTCAQKLVRYLRCVYQTYSRKNVFLWLIQYFILIHLTKLLWAFFFFSFIYLFIYLFVYLFIF